MSKLTPSASHEKRLSQLDLDTGNKESRGTPKRKVTLGFHKLSLKKQTEPALHELLPIPHIIPKS